jgi:hypothetical protein
MLFINDGKSIFEGEPKEGLNNSQVKSLLSSYEEILRFLKST